MAGSVLNSTAVLRLNFSAKLNISASISATSPSCKPIVRNCASKSQINSSKKDWSIVSNQKKILVQSLQKRFAENLFSKLIA